MAETPNVDQFIMGGGSSVWSLKNKPVGTSIEGYVLDRGLSQVKDFNTGSPKFYDDGNPVYQLWVEYQTNERSDSDDDGKRRVFFKPQWRSELSRVLKDAGEATLRIGSWQKITFVREEPSKMGGGQAKKCVEIEYRGPEVQQESQPAAQPSGAHKEVDTSQLDSDTVNKLRAAGVNI